MSPAWLEAARLHLQHAVNFFNSPHGGPVRFLAEFTVAARRADARRSGKTAGRGLMDFLTNSEDAHDAQENRTYGPACRRVVDCFRA